MTVGKKRAILKHTFTTFDSAAAGFLYTRGARIRTLYTCDGVSCYEVNLKGRKQVRLLGDDDYLQVTSHFDLLKGLVEPRIAPPIYTVKVNNQFAILRDVLGTKDEYFALARNPEHLGKTSDPSELTELKTWAALDSFVKDALSLDYRQVKIFVGFGAHSPIPYRETHDLRLLDRVIQEKLAPEVEASNG